ncbi:NB-ARC domain-containing protein [Actinomadura sp. HBU206391]|uniref:NB-ARC domain-containing protein n=1 Tax=Actinomadura sp. HBU206391 TaxID=2731692 RepID=UPI001650445E|nr:NB-ARC domain-containing protein [Actinomadura sp. HBU206391]MBC6458283.1 hypothetical protein [Actinomadura sp. HBU206391]
MVRRRRLALWVFLTVAAGALAAAGEWIPEGWPVWARRPVAVLVAMAAGAAGSFVSEALAASREGGRRRILAGGPGFWGESPRLPPQFVDRPAEVVAASTALRGGTRAVALVGLGGSGKSTLAAAAARPPQLRGRFRGRFRHTTWLPVGPSVEPLSVLTQLGHRLGDAGATYSSVGEARDAVTALLDGRRLLIVLDNVWTEDSLRAFVGLGRTSVLFTTRSEDLARALNAERIPVEELTREQALALLARWTHDRPVPEAEARALCARLGDLALGVAMAGAMIARGRSAEEVTALIDRDLSRISGRFDPLYSYRTLRAAIDAGIDDLPDQFAGMGTGGPRDRYLELAVFTGRGPFPRSAAEALWAATLPDLYAVSEVLEEFRSRSLLTEYDGWYIAHDLQYDAMNQHPDAPDLTHSHRCLIDGWSASHDTGWSMAAREDAYLSANLAWHLHQAGSTDALAELLTDQHWMLHRIRSAGLAALLTDYTHAPTPLTQTIRRALAISTAAVSLDPDLLTGQLMGRLLSHPDPAISAWAAALTPPHATTWIVPLAPDILTSTTTSLQRTLTGDLGEVNAVAYSPDGTQLATGDNDGVVRIWDLATGRHTTLTGHTAEVRAVAYSPDGTHLATGSNDRTVRVWNLVTGRGTVLTGHADGVWALAYSPDGTHLATGSKDRTARIWNLVTGRHTTLTGHTDVVRAVAYSPDGGLLATGSHDATVRVWDTATGEQTTLGPLGGWMWALAFSPDGAHLAICNNDGMSVLGWTLDSGEVSELTAAHPRAPWVLAYSPDGTHLATACDDRPVRVWDLAARQHITLTGHVGAVWAVAYSPDGTHLATASHDRTVRVWEPAMAGQDDPAELEESSASALSPDGTHLAMVGYDGTMRVRDLATGQLAALTGHTKRGRAAAYSPDGTHIATSSDDRTVRVWDLATGEYSTLISGGNSLRYILTTDTSRATDGESVVTTGNDWVWVMAYSPDGAHLATGGVQDEVRVWDLAAIQYVSLTGHADGVWAMAYSPNGTHLATGSEDRMVRMWDLATGQHSVLTGHTGPVRAVAFSPDGTHLATGSQDQTVRIWDLTTGQHTTLIGHTDMVWAMAYSPDGTHLVTAGRDRAVRVWEVATSATVALWHNDEAIRKVVMPSNDEIRILTDRTASRLEIRRN